MKKIILVLFLLVTMSTQAQNLFVNFTYDTALVSNADKAELYERTTSFFKSQTKENESVCLNMLPLKKTEFDKSKYYTDVVKTSGSINCTFIDEAGIKYNIGVSCFNGKYVYYTTYNKDVNKAVIIAKIIELKKIMQPYIGGSFTPKTEINTNKSTSVSSSSVSTCSSTQCSGTTQKGSQCKRTTTNCNGRCYQH